MRTKRSQEKEQKDKDSKSPKDAAVGPTPSPVARTKKPGQTQLPFTMKDHLEMYTNAQVKAGHAQQYHKERRLINDKSSNMKQTNKTITLPNIPTSNDLSTYQQFENSESKPTIKKGFSKPIDVSISASASSRVDNISKATKVVSMPQSPIQKKNEKEPENLGKSFKMNQEARIKYNNTTSQVENPLQSSHTESAKIMGEYHMNIQKINSSEDLNKIDFNDAQQYIAQKARESQKLIDRVEQYQDQRSSVAKNFGSPKAQPENVDQLLRNTMQETMGSKASQNTINIISASGQQNIINIDELSPTPKNRRQLSSTMKQPMQTQLLKPQKVSNTGVTNESQKSVKFNSMSFGQTGQSAQANKSNEGRESSQQDTEHRLMNEQEPNQPDFETEVGGYGGSKSRGTIEQVDENYSDEERQSSIHHPRAEDGQVRKINQNKEGKSGYHTIAERTDDDQTQSPMTTIKGNQR